MAGSVNKVILIGNLGRDPEVRMTPGGGKVANFSIATSETWNNKSTGQKEEKTEWHKLVAWGVQADIIEKYVKKGTKLFVEGKLETRKWTDKDNQERYTTEIKVDNFTMLDSKRDGEGGGYAPRGGDNYDQSAPAPSREVPMAAPKKMSADPAFDDEIPF